MKAIYEVSGLAAGALLFGGVCLLRSEYERDCLSVETYTIRSPKIKGRGKTFVFLSDLHDHEFGRNNIWLIEAVRRVKPDAVLVGGDMMVAKGVGKLETALELLCTLAKEFPVVCGNGNHESRMKRETHIYGTKYLEYRGALRKAGVVYLADSHINFGEDFAFYGLDIPERVYRSGKDRFACGYMDRALGRPMPERFCILLAHSPFYFGEYASWGADLALAGHFHGGTIRIPVLGGLMTPQYQFFFPWCGGLYDARKELTDAGQAGCLMLVSRGLGTHSINIRFNNKPHVAVIRAKGL